MSTTVTITFVSTCPSEGHVRVSASADGTGSRQFDYGVADLRDTMDWSEAERVVKDLLRMHFRGLTAVQAKNELLAGITLTI